MSKLVAITAQLQEEIESLSKKVEVLTAKIDEGTSELNGVYSEISSLFKALRTLDPDSEFEVSTPKFNDGQTQLKKTEVFNVLTGSPQHVKTISKMVGANTNNVSAHLYALIHEGRAVRAERGYYMRAKGSVESQLASADSSALESA